MRGSRSASALDSHNSVGASPCLTMVLYNPNSINTEPTAKKRSRNQRDDESNSDRSGFLSLPSSATDMAPMKRVRIADPPDDYLWSDSSDNVGESESRSSTNGSRVKRSNRRPRKGKPRTTPQTSVPLIEYPAETLFGQNNNNDPRNCAILSSLLAL